MLQKASVRGCCGAMATTWTEVPKGQIFLFILETVNFSLHQYYEESTLRRKI